MLDFRRAASFAFGIAMFSLNFQIDNELYSHIKWKPYHLNIRHAYIDKPFDKKECDLRVSNEIRALRHSSSSVRDIQTVWVSANLRRLVCLPGSVE